MIKRLSENSWKHLLKWVWFGLEGLVVILMILVVWGARDTLVDIFRTARYGYFVWMLVFYTIAIGAIAIGWHLLMHHLGVQSNIIFNVKIYVYTLAARRVPIPFGYIAGRAVFYQRLGIPARVCAFVGAIEVLLSIVSGLMVGGGALVLFLGPSLGSLMLFTAIELLGLIILYPSVLRWILARFNYQVPEQLTVLHVLSWVGLYIAMWIGGGLMTCSVISAIYPLRVNEFSLIVSLWSLTGALAHVTFLLPSSLGVSEITLSLLLSRVVPLPIAISTAILIRILTMAFDIMWSSSVFLEREGIFRLTNSG